MPPREQMIILGVCVVSRTQLTYSAALWIVRAASWSGVANPETFNVRAFFGGIDRAANAALGSAAMANLFSAVNMYVVAEVSPASTVG